MYGDKEREKKNTLCVYATKVSRSLARWTHTHTRYMQRSGIPRGEVPHTFPPVTSIGGVQGKRHSVVALRLSCVVKIRTDGNGQVQEKGRGGGIKDSIIPPSLLECSGAAVADAARKKKKVWIQKG
jgi:hypothetical protein